MLLFLFAGFVGVIGLVSLFRMLTHVSKNRNDLTPLDVATRIENHLQEMNSPGEWDQFTSIPIPDKRLDTIRLRCIELDSPLPISVASRTELDRMVQHLKSLSGRSTE